LSFFYFGDKYGGWLHAAGVGVQKREGEDIGVVLWVDICAVVWCSLIMYSMRNLWLQRLEQLSFMLR